MALSKFKLITSEQSSPNILAGEVTATNLSHLFDKQLTHSLHHLIPSVDVAFSNVFEFFINGFSKPGDKIFESYAGLGSFRIQANLQDRSTISIAHSRLGQKFSTSLFTEVSFEELLFSLTKVNLKRPVDFSDYQKYFVPFFEMQTFRELANLRNFIFYDEDSSPELRELIEIISLSCLHGPGEGSFSVSTPYLYSLTPKNQKFLNNKKRQKPQFKPILSRIIKKSAQIQKDFNRIEKFEETISSNKTFFCDSVKISDISPDSSDFAFVRIPLEFSEPTIENQWLRNWFSKLDTRLSTLDHEGIQEKNISKDLVGYLELFLRMSLRTLKVRSYLVLQLEDKLLNILDFIGIDQTKLLEFCYAINEKGKRLSFEEMFIVDKFVEKSEENEGTNSYTSCIPSSVKYFLFKVI